MWQDLARDFSLVAVDLPGSGQPEGRPDLMSPQATGEEDAANYGRIASGWINGGHLTT
jgi:hypothetical protein